jgi:hypothetical protein
MRILKMLLRRNRRGCRSWSVLARKKPLTSSLSKRSVVNEAISAAV